MPLLSESTYKNTFYLFNGHLQTIIPALFYNKDIVNFQRERIITHDDDFLDLDWSLTGSNKLVILSHGLEGNSGSSYILRMAKHMNENNYDVLAWNYRGCSGEMNKQFITYHSGFTQDLHEVLQHVVTNKKHYKEIVLIGFSLGGNVTLKYLGEQQKNLFPQIQKAVVFSVPCDLKSGAEKLAKPISKIYMQRFLDSFEPKFREKNKLFPNRLKLDNYHKIKDFFAFDNTFTAPMYGFKDVYDYYEKASSKPYIQHITCKTLIINAQNDPFLGKGCYPVKEAEASKNVFLEIPRNGGHVGFPFKNSRLYWPGKRVIEFLKD